MIFSVSAESLVCSGVWSMPNYTHKENKCCSQNVRLFLGVMITVRIRWAALYVETLFWAIKSQELDIKFKRHLFLFQRLLQTAQSLEETQTSLKSTLPGGGCSMPWRTKFIASSVKAGSWPTKAATAYSQCPPTKHLCMCYQQQTKTLWVPCLVSCDPTAFCVTKTPPQQCQGRGVINRCDVRLGSPVSAETRAACQGAVSWWTAAWKNSSGST